jgi:hypothetical protein
VHRPAARELLSRAENLFHDDEELVLAPLIAAASFLQAAEVVLGREEPVHVIDAKAGHRATPDQVEHEAMHFVEHRRIFHPQRRELVHVEETTVIDLFRRDAPVREPVRLRVQQAIERVEAARLAGQAVDLADAVLDQRCDADAASGKRREAPLDDFLLPRPRRNRFRIAFAARRKVPAGGQDALQFVGVRPGVLVQPMLEAHVQNRRVCIRRDRQRLLEVTHDEGAVVVGEFQFLTFQDFPVLIAEDRDEDLVGQLVLDRMPFDVEKVREARARAVLEHIEPPRIGRFRDAHVVGHQVHHVPHAARLQRVDPAPVVGVRTDIRVEARGIGDVVAVRTAGNRLQIRRCIAIADAERVEVIHNRVRVTKREATVELKTIS